MIKVLFVCLGNICRSPLAEAIFNKKLQDLGLSDHFLADSAGTSDYHIGDPPDRRSVENARVNGVRISHRARQVTGEDLRSFDYVLAMDHHNFKSIKSLAHQFQLPDDHILMMRSFESNADSMEVPDPYYGGPQGFQQVFDILERANQAILDHLLIKHSL